MHYYQFNISDYRKDTTHLNRIEHSIYRDLIDWYYLEEKPIPLETQQVTRRLRLGLEDEQSLRNVLNDFFKMTKNGWSHERIEQDLLWYKERGEQSRTNGKLGGRPKITQRVSKITQQQPDGNPKLTPTNNYKLITNNQKPIQTPTPPNGVESRFLRFWDKYPKKKSKGDAIKAFNAIKPDEQLLETMISTIERATKSADWQKEGGQFIPYPASWLRARCWEDEFVKPLDAYEQFLILSQKKEEAMNAVTS